MRQEMYAYDFDWMMASSVQLVHKVTGCSQAEIEQMLPYLPYFNKTIDIMLRQGEVVKPLFKLLERWADEYYYAERKGMKRVVSTFMTHPILFHAMNLNQINIELLTAFLNFFYHRSGYDFMDLCIEKGFTETSCAAQRGSMGAYLAGLAKDFDAVVISSPGTCDSNANAFAFISNYLKKPFYAIDNPARIPDEDVRAYQRKDYKAMIAFLEDVTGHQLDFDKLRGLLEETKIQEAIIQEIQEMMTLVPCPLPSFYHFLFYLGYNLMLGQPEYTALLQAIHKVTRENAAKGVAGTPTGRERARPIMFYIDHYNTDMAFWKWMEDAELSHMGQIATPTFYQGQPYLKGNEAMGWFADTSSPEAMLNSIVDMNVRQPMARSIRGPFDGPNQWLEETLTMASLYKADCAIFSGTYGCRNTWGIVQPMARELEKHGIPTLICTADGFDERPQSWAQSQAQIEEFLTLRGIV